MLVILPETLDDFLIPFELPAVMFHGVENEHALRDVFVLMRGEPVGEDGIGGLRIVLLKLLHFDTRSTQGLLERVEFSLCLYIRLAKVIEEMILFSDYEVEHPAK
jgi:hypothetical protein